ncbi:MAG: hypothetical protein II266_06585, partial [Clostridia bacterium]|nr:hypothetical protein [Clostridia bacterium]
MKRILCAVLALLLAVFLSACQKEDAGEGVSVLRFSDAVSLDKIKSLDNKQVSIIGYMATMSPISGKFMYLMNMPYQSCPFCLPNTTQLSNTMAVYAPEGKTFGYTDQAIRVTGIMKMEDVQDEFGYTYNYRIVNAAYETVDLSALSGEYALWTQIASDGLVKEIDDMFGYVHFLSQWPEYESSYVDENGNTVTFMLYPGDAEMYLKDEKASSDEVIFLTTKNSELCKEPLDIRHFFGREEELFE